MSLPIAIIDAFTSAPFKGNPAAVCLMEQQPEENWMQQVAEEMNLSETAFLLPREDGSYSLRWFTPTNEVEFMRTCDACKRPLFVDEWQCTSKSNAADSIREADY